MKCFLLVAWWEEHSVTSRWRKWRRCTFESYRHAQSVEVKVCGKDGLETFVHFCCVLCKISFPEILQHEYWWSRLRGASKSESQAGRQEQENSNSNNNNDNNPKQKTKPQRNGWNSWDYFLLWKERSIMKSFKLEAVF